MTQTAATLVGAGAIALWSALAVLTTSAGGLPPFQLTALTFLIGAIAGLAIVAIRPSGFSALRQSPAVWLHGVAGLFGYHALFFAALAFAPAAEANLLNYLWPLLIVVFAAFLPGERLKAHHLAGALLGLCGTLVLIATKGGIGAGFSASSAIGYLCALGAAVTWAAYSVSSRLFPAVPTEAVAGFCLGTAALAGLCHLAFETTVWPRHAGQWAAIIALGLGPLGLAFYLWDVGMKRGEVKVLGALSYAAPVASTGLLVLFGQASASWALGLAVILIVAGAAIAGKDLRKN